MFAFAALQPGNTTVVQVYSNRTVEEIVCRDELEALERSNPRLNGPAGEKLANK
jgi:ferredoxin-NADP reductase